MPNLVDRAAVLSGIHGVLPALEAMPATNRT